MSKVLRLLQTLGHSSKDTSSNNKYSIPKRLSPNQHHYCAWQWRMGPSLCSLEPSNNMEQWPVFNPMYNKDTATRSVSPREPLGEIIHPNSWISPVGDSVVFIRTRVLWERIRALWLGAVHLFSKCCLLHFFPAHFKDRNTASLSVHTSERRKSKKCTKLGVGGLVRLGSTAFSTKL
jgi:hypothetical protein